MARRAAAVFGVLAAVGLEACSASRSFASWADVFAEEWIRISPQSRLVVDTGLHAKRRTRQQAIDHGIEPQEVERYVVCPVRRAHG